MKKFLTYVALIIIILIPSFSEGTGYIKRINVKYYDLSIYVEGEKINFPTERKPFIYEDTLWIPLSELAIGLDMDYKLDTINKSIYLDSKGKLENIDSSKIIDSFQLGYEIENKENKMDKLEDNIYALKEGIEEDDLSLNNYTERTLNVYFGDVKIYLDEKEITMYEEPLYCNGEVYVSLWDISNYLYINPSLDVKNNRINIDTNGILVKKDHYAEIDQLISFRKLRNYLLDIKIDNLNKYKELYQDLNIPYENITNIEDLEKHLNMYLSTLEGVNFNISVKKPYSRWLDLTFVFSKGEANEWRSLQRRDVENYIWNIYSAILTLYDDEISIKGQVLNPFYSPYSLSTEKYYVTFTTKDMDLDFDFSNSKLRKNYRIDSDYLEDILNDELDKYSVFEFIYMAEQNGYTVDLDISVNRQSFFTQDIYEKIGFLRRLNNEIRRLNPDIIVDGKIYFGENNTDEIKFNIYDNKIISSDLIEETEDFLNGLYGSFSKGLYIFRLDYSIYEVNDDQFKLIVETDFSLDDYEWKRAGDEGEEMLFNRINNAVSHIKALWDVDVKVEVYDEDGIEISIPSIF